MTTLALIALAVVLAMPALGAWAAILALRSEPDDGYDDTYPDLAEMPAVIPPDNEWIEDFTNGRTA